MNKSFMHGSSCICRSCTHISLCVSTHKYKYWQNIEPIGGCPADFIFSHYTTLTIPSATLFSPLFTLFANPFEFWRCGFFAQLSLLRVAGICLPRKLPFFLTSLRSLISSYASKI